MRIAVSGSGRTGKTTFIRDFLKEWPSYKTPEKTYRTSIEGNKHSQKTNGKVQWKLLNQLSDQVMGYAKTDNVIHDRCPLDNLVYTLWGYDKGNKGCDSNLVERTISIVKESMRFVDIIFFIGTSPINKIILRETDTKKDLKYLEEIDVIFKEIYNRYRSDGCHTFFPKDDSPALIDLHGTPEERIALAKLYLTPEGASYGEDQAIFNPNDLLQMEDLIKQQKSALDEENRERDLYKKFSL